MSVDQHEYSVIGHDRAKVGRFVWIAATTLGAAIVAGMHWIQGLLQIIGVPNRFQQFASFTVSAATLYSLSYWLFNQWIWKMSLVSKFVGVADISGKWQCEGVTKGSSEGPMLVDTRWEAEITIVQKWDKILIYLRSPSSKSDSVSASLIRKEGIGHVLMYSYRNEAAANSQKLHSHVGYCELHFSEDLTHAEGDYFNNLGRVTWGRMQLTKVGVKHGR